MSFYACAIESLSTGSRASGKKALSRKILCYPVLGVAIIAYLAISFFSLFLLFVMDTSKVSDTVIMLVLNRAVHFDCRVIVPSHLLLLPVVIPLVMKTAQVLYQS